MESRSLPASADSTGELGGTGFVPLLIPRSIRSATGSCPATSLNPGSSETSGPPTGLDGLPIWCGEDSPVRISAKPTVAGLEPGSSAPSQGSGPSSADVSSRSDRDGSSWRIATSTSGGRRMCDGTCLDSGMPACSFSCAPRRSVRRIDVPAAGWLPTPTAKGNHYAPSMRKWPAYRRLQDSRLGPLAGVFRWLMGWPAASVLSEPSETPWCRSSLTMFSARSRKPKCT
jgi:hypothetical protein